MRNTPWINSASLIRWPNYSRRLGDHHVSPRVAIASKKVLGTDKWPDYGLQEVYLTAGRCRPIEEYAPERVGLALQPFAAGNLHDLRPSQDDDVEDFAPTSAVY